MKKFIRLTDTINLFIGTTKKLDDRIHNVIIMKTKYEYLTDGVLIYDIPVHDIQFYVDLINY